MQCYRESQVEFADFIFDRQKVVCYGLQNTAGGTATILNFPTPRLAAAFRRAYLGARSFQIIENEAKLICLADYDTVMRKSDDDPRVRALRYSRDFMMGTLAHLS